MIMRWYVTLSVFLNILFVLIFIALTSKPLTPIQSIILSKPWSLSSRNNIRLERLYKKYNLLLNFAVFQRNNFSDKTMIYSCQSFCGGWGDRLRGILSVYILSLLTNRHFMIDMNYPCDISKVLEPNFVNWTYSIRNKSKNRTRLYINTMGSWKKTFQNEIANTIKSKDFAQIWSSYDDVIISTNSDYMILAFRNSYMSNKTRGLFGQIPRTEMTMQTLFAFLFEFLFKPSISVRQRVDTILFASQHRHLICLHIRIGKNPTNPFDHAFKTRGNTTKVMLDFTDHYLLNKSSSLVFVTSDSGQAVSDVLHHYPNSSMTIVGPILHIDRFDRRSSTVCEGFLKVIADFYLLGECQTSLLSNSGFSSWANRRREQPNAELYFYNERSTQMRRG